MSDRDEEVRRVVAELDGHLAQVEANMALLKALVAEDDGAGPAGEDPSGPRPQETTDDAFE